MCNIDFTSKELQFPCHPRHEESARKILTMLKEQGLSEHFLIFSSGTNSTDLKGYALSRRALLTNAEAVNAHFNLTSSDVWAISIPCFHVGGLSVLARAHVLGSKPIDTGIWTPETWSRKISDKNVNITTVVPTQLYDLVKLNLQAPPTLKYLIVGGDYLSEELERRAICLGWPIVRTFGMTEVSSQLATAKSPGEPMQVLPIHEVETDEERRLYVKSQSLFTFEFKLKDKLEITYAPSQFYPTSDLVELNGTHLRHLGRIDDQIKVSGRLVSLNSLKEKLAAFTLDHNLYGKLEIALEADERTGTKLILLHLPPFNKQQELENLFSPFKITFKENNDFQRTDLGKFKRL